MIGYTVLGTNDLPRATAFYDALLAEFGAKRVMELPRGYIWAAAPNQPMFGVMTPFDGGPATVGNGCMVALPAKDKAQVDRVHARAIELGATCEGEPGQRMPTFYGAYFRDPDGNKLACFKMG